MVLELLVAVALTINIISVMLGIYRLVHMNSPNVDVAGKVTAVLSLTGPAPDLDQLVDRLYNQSIELSELLIAVESKDDPAYRRAKTIAETSRMPVRIVIAGLASDQAQKCRNQQAALAQIGEDTRYIVLMDGDIRPSRDWLRTLVSPLAAEEFDLVTGHRWHQVAGDRLGAHLATAIDRAATLLPRFDFSFAAVVWGGSGAMSRNTAARLQLAACLDRVLSDDLSIGAQASRLGLTIATRSALLVASPIDLTFAAAWRFGRRQYQIVKIYLPGLWWIALAIILCRLIGWVAAVMLAFQSTAVLWPILVLATLGLAKQMIIGAVSARGGLPDNESIRKRQYILGVLQPLVDLFHVSIILAAGWTQRVYWGHVTYEVAGPDRIRVIERRPFLS